jgi:hypothetical protein
VTAAALLERARTLGVELEPVGDGLRCRGRRSALRELLPDLEIHKPAIVRELRDRATVRTPAEAEVIARAIVAQRYLREGAFAPEPAPCVYHCGLTNERCRRCGAPFAEHCSQP